MLAQSDQEIMEHQLIFIYGLSDIESVFIVDLPSGLSMRINFSLNMATKYKKIHIPLLQGLIIEAWEEFNDPFFRDMTSLQKRIFGKQVFTIDIKLIAWRNPSKNTSLPKKDSK